MIEFAVNYKLKIKHPPQRCEGAYHKGETI